jgi:hypothetical protein
VRRVRSSRVVLSPRRWCQVCAMAMSTLRADTPRRRRGLTSPIPRGERGVSRKAIAQGVSERFGQPVVTTLVGRLPFSAHEAAGAPGARHSLRPLLLRDNELQDSDAKSRRGNAVSCFLRRHRPRHGYAKASPGLRSRAAEVAKAASGRSSIPETSRLTMTVSGILGRPVEPGDDSGGFCWIRRRRITVWVPPRCGFSNMAPISIIK